MVRLWTTLLLSATLLILGCERMEVVETTYPNFESAVNAKAMGDGKWVPGFLPPSATSIREVHNIDTNEVWLFFRLDSDDIPAMITFCKKIIERDVVFPRQSPGNWWPHALTQHPEDPQKIESIYDYYRCTPRGVMAINQNKSEAHFWQ